MDLIGVRIEYPTNQPIVLLRETRGKRYLAIWIGAMEATAIAYALEGVTTPRPFTHDLLRITTEVLGAQVTRVTVTELRDQRLLRGSGSQPERRGTPRQFPSVPTRSPLRLVPVLPSTPPPRYWKTPASR